MSDAETSEEPAAGAAAETARRRWPLPVRLLLIYGVWSLLIGASLPILQVRPGRRSLRTKVEQLAPHAREVTFRTSDGLQLSGFYASPAPGRPQLVVQHGVKTTRDDVMPWAKVFAAEGYGVLVFDWRAHGLSDGDRIGFGAHAAEDVRAALDFLAAQPELEGVDIGWVALSMGAASSAMAARAMGLEVRCMVLDSPFGNLGRMVDFRLGIFGPPGWLPRQIAPAVARLWTGTWPGDIQPERELAEHFPPRPIFVLHGEEDPTVPTQEGRSLLAAYPGPKQAWFSPGMGHTLARSYLGRTWFRKVGGFLAEHLRGAPDPEALALRRRPDAPPEG